MILFLKVCSAVLARNIGFGRMVGLAYGRSTPVARSKWLHRSRIIHASTQVDAPY
jgi:hypothetical protein